MSGYSTRRVAELTGVSYRQLDYWARTGMLTPSLGEASGSGTRRRWSDDDVRAVAVARSVATALTKNAPGSSLPVDLLARVVRCFTDAGRPARGHLVVRANAVAWVPTDAAVLRSLAAKGPALVASLASAVGSSVPRAGSAAGVFPAGDPTGAANEPDPAVPAGCPPPRAVPPDTAGAAPVPRNERAPVDAAVTATGAR